MNPNNLIDADDGLDLTLTNVNRTQSGVYICTGRITGNDDIVESNVTLNIQCEFISTMINSNDHYYTFIIPDPVIITSFTPDNSTVTVGSILTLNCTFDGNPSPSILWSHNGSMLDVPSNPNVVETITDTYALLEVTFVDITVSGEYACGVNNTIGLDQTDSTFFTVQGLSLISLRYQQA